MERRREFIREFGSGEWTMTELCQGYGISRPTGYALWQSWEREGEAGLEDGSRAPHRHPNQTAAAIEAQVLELRQAHMRWGPRKLKAYLERVQAEQRWPAASTIGGLLQRTGLVVGRKRRRKVPPYTQPFQSASRPNDLWCADFKGWFRTGDGERNDPLTISDACSRYLLRNQVVEKTDTTRVQAIFEAGFREYGMPWAIRSDNGAPFASRAIAGLSRLAVWWMKLGIVPERIAAGHPEQNGRHERMHRTLKEEVASPPAADRRAQQRALDQFRREYNEERPHEALGMQTPSACYERSSREYPARLAEPDYGSALLVRRVRELGAFSWKHQNVFLSKTLRGERVGLLPLDERYYRVYFAAFPLARFDSHRLRIERLRDDDGEER
ncbi:MAG TPA: IS481 family transposase [Bryobacteraceae bacterium]|nr:IS481 family transposase [Bryobacteraceae bacterium]